MCICESATIAALGLNPILHLSIFPVPGRGGNVWISPEGCAMFSLHIKLLLSSPLGQKLSFIQHITTLAVVEAVTSMHGYQVRSLLYM